ncbi:MAG TPA: hypothetical protein VLX92_02950 [Kofleriaceae bacterium]|nr:hypothetical protein [Kofleriaceae bacterium]
MNPELRDLARDAERAAERGDPSAAIAGFLDAGSRAAGYQLWRAAARYFRNALELDLLEREPVVRLAGLAARLGNELDWKHYLRVLDDAPAWPRVGCRGARILTHDTGSIVECPGAGPVLELLMTASDLVEVAPDGRFAHMPLAMALVILRRALWPVPREVASPLRVRVAFAGRSPVWLDERGEWSDA